MPSTYTSRLKKRHDRLFFYIYHLCVESVTAYCRWSAVQSMGMWSNNIGRMKKLSTTLYWLTNIGPCMFMNVFYFSSLVLVHTVKCIKWKQQYFILLNYLTFGAIVNPTLFVFLFWTYYRYCYSISSITLITPKQCTNYIFCTYIFKCFQFPANFQMVLLLTCVLLFDYMDGLITSFPNLLNYTRC